MSRKKLPQYAATVINGKIVYMHEMIMCQILGIDNIPEGCEVIHKNGNTLDNRRANLQLRLKK